MNEFVSVMLLSAVFVPAVVLLALTQVNHEQ